jgi:hypothetical protein
MGFAYSLRDFQRLVPGSPAVPYLGLRTRALKDLLLGGGDLFC